MKQPRTGHLHPEPPWWGGGWSTARLDLAAGQKQQGPQITSPRPFLLAIGISRRRSS
jgi:hypothetical protein